MKEPFVELNRHAARFLVRAGVRFVCFLEFVDEVDQLKESVIAEKEIEYGEQILLRPLDFRQGHSDQFNCDIVDD